MKIIDGVFFMKKTIVYSTTTGNTGAMAAAIAEGCREKGDEVLVFEADSCDREVLLSSDLIYLGSPAMGDEVLEDSMEDLYRQIESGLSGKRVAIFGSYDWGDGKWLRDWAERLRGAGALLENGDGLMINLEPEGEGIEECRRLGKI